MGWSGLAVIAGIVGFPALALLFTLLGGWPGIAGALATCAVFLAVTVGLDSRPHGRPGQ